MGGAGPGPGPGPGRMNSYSVQVGTMARVIHLPFLIPIGYINMNICMYIYMPRRSDLYASNSISMRKDNMLLLEPAAACSVVNRALRKTRISEKMRPPVQP